MLFFWPKKAQQKIDICWQRTHLTKACNPTYHIWTCLQSANPWPLRWTSKDQTKTDRRGTDNRQKVRHFKTPGIFSTIFVLITSINQILFHFKCDLSKTHLLYIWRDCVAFHQISKQLFKLMNDNNSFVRFAQFRGMFNQVQLFMCFNLKYLCQKCNWSESSWRVLTTKYAPKLQISLSHRWI